jgi:hypothetical protein
VPAERRTDEQIRGEIATEREQLVAAIGDLREGVAAKKKIAVAAGAAAGAGVAAAAIVSIVRRFRHG